MDPTPVSRTDRERLEDWGQTFVLAMLAGSLPALVGWSVRLFGPRIAGAFSAAGGPELQAEAAALAPWVVLVSSPLVVLVLARAAASLTHGSPMRRAIAVGLGPGAMMLWVLAASGSLRAGMLAGLSAWLLLNLACAALAGALWTRRHRRTGAGRAGRRNPEELTD